MYIFPSPHGLSKASSRLASSSSCMSSTPSIRSKRSTRNLKTSSWKPRSQTAPLAAVSAFHGEAVQSYSPVTAISTLGTSPLRHEIVPEALDMVEDGGAGSMLSKRDRDVVNAAEPNMEGNNPDVFGSAPIEATERSRIDDMISSPGAGPSAEPLQPPASDTIPIPQQRAVAAQPIASPQTSWLESFYRPSRSPSKAPIHTPDPVLLDSSPNQPSTTSSSIDPPIPQPEVQAVQPHPETTIEQNSPAPSGPEIIDGDSAMPQPAARPASIRNGFAGWFGASARTSYISDEPSHIIQEPTLSAPPSSQPESSSSTIPSPNTASATSAIPNVDSELDSKHVQNTTANDQTVRQTPSIYGLRIPFLAASKPTNEVPTAEAIPTVSTDTLASTLPQSSNQSAVAESESTMAETLPSAVIPQIEVSDVVSAPLPPASTAPVPNSWWSYVGLASSTPLPASPKVTASIRSNQDIPEITLESAPDVNASSKAMPLPQGLDASPAAPTVPDADFPVSNSEDIPSSRVSWYSSVWGWNAPAPVQSSSEGEAKTDDDEAPVTEPLTESQKIKEDALARDEPTAADTPSPDTTPLLTTETRASWISFFSSRNRAYTKAITDGAESQGEMEVMDIDDDMPAASTTPSIATAPTVSAGTVASTPGKKAKPAPIGPKPSPDLTPPSTPNTPSTPLTSSKDIKKQASDAKKKRDPKDAPKPKLPNFVLPTWGDTFYSAPQAYPPPSANTTLRKTFGVVYRMLATPLPLHPEIQSYQEERSKRLIESQIPLEVSKSEGERRQMSRIVGLDLPRSFNVLGSVSDLHHMKRVVIFGVHGWFPVPIVRSVLGEPTGTSKKFADEMASQLEQYAAENKFELESVTKIPLEGEGSIESRVDKLFQNWQANEDWVKALHEADAILVATHSQGCPVSTLLLDRLINEGHVYTGLNLKEMTDVAEAHNSAPRSYPQKIVLLGMCGVHHGPFGWLSNSGLTNSYLNWVESPAARQLFELKDKDSAVSKAYRAALSRNLNHGVKFVYVASLNDQVVPIYSASFVATSHPLILRALYIDGDAYNASDFLSNLIVLLLRIRNAGLDDGGLLAHLSDATAGSLSGVGHSTAYEEPAVYRLALRFLFETTGPMRPAELSLGSFDAKALRNDYMIPWILRGLIEDRRINSLFGHELAELRVAFDKWQPKTTILREVRKKLEPVRQPPPSNDTLTIPSKL